MMISTYKNKWVCGSIALLRGSRLQAVVINRADHIVGEI